jgi:hypothetical protein
MKLLYRVLLAAPPGIASIMEEVRTIRGRVRKAVPAIML